MQILSLRLKNIKSHREAEFRFSPGINVLAGPNGAGKSTVFEAVGYALFGVDARDIVGRAERFLTIGAKRGEVEVVFRSDQEENWRVTRTVGASPRWLLARERGGEFETEEHAGMAETEERLREILGLDSGRSLAEHFRQVIGPLQSEFLGPFVLRGGKRQEAFDRILGIDGWRRTFEGTLDLQKAVQGRIACLEAEMTGRSEQLRLLPVRREELKSLKRQIQEKENELRAAEKELAQAERQLAARDRQRQDLEQAEADCRLLTERIANGTDMTARQRERVAEAQMACAIVEASRAGYEAFGAAETRLQDLRARERQRQEGEKKAIARERERDRLRQQVAHEEAEIAAAARQLSAEEAALTAREADLRPDPEAAARAARLPELRRRVDLCRGERAMLQGRRESLLEGRDKLATGTCPFLGEECGNLAAAEFPLDARLAEFDSAMARLQGVVAAAEADLSAAEEAEKAIAALEARGRELLRQRENLAVRGGKNREREERLASLRDEAGRAAAEAEAERQALAPLAALDAEITAVEKERTCCQSDRDRYQAHLGPAGELAMRRQMLEKYEKALADLAAQREKKEGMLALLRQGYDTEAHAAARRARDTLLAGTAALRQEVQGAAGQRGRIEGEIGELLKVEAEVEAKRSAAARLREQETLVKFLRTQVFNQVSARLSERFREEISRRADRLYRTIAETEEELQWGEGYQVVLRDLDPEGKPRERTDDQLSGGQTMSAVVALRLALLQTIGARVAFFDEPTSNLDADRRENLARAFRSIDLGREEVTRHWYDQLFLVSHDVAFAEITDQVIELGD